MSGNDTNTAADAGQWPRAQRGSLPSSLGRGGRRGGTVRRAAGPAELTTAGAELERRVAARSNSHLATVTEQLSQLSAGVSDLRSAASAQDARINALLGAQESAARESADLRRLLSQQAAAAAPQGGSPQPSTVSLDAQSIQVWQLHGRTTGVLCRHRAAAACQRSGRRSFGRWQGECV